MSEPVYEYRILTPGRHYPHEIFTFLSNDEMWVNYKPHIDPEDEGLYDGVPDGIAGLVEATRREERVRSGNPVWAERRIVGKWEKTDL